MNLLFDFDGTLCDSIDEVLESANSFLVRIGKQPITKQEYELKGLKNVVKTRKISKFSLLIFLFIGRRKIASLVDTLDTFENLPKVIAKLSKKHTLGIVTSNSKSNVEKFLKHHNLATYFKIIESELSIFGKHKKIEKCIQIYGFNKSETVYIGDETRDILAAKKAHIKAISVTWGYEGKKLLKKANPDVLIDNPEELLNLVRKT